ncbi:MAG: hypothetical protein VKL59_12675 [Nostocaceae cyanobacterium]|nr:hypothetical protein [Nostocaceae cyanobacterium]
MQLTSCTQQRQPLYIVPWLNQGTSRGEAFGCKTLILPMTYRPNASPLPQIFDFENTS